MRILRKMGTKKYLEQCYSQVSKKKKERSPLSELRSKAFWVLVFFVNPKRQLGIWSRNRGGFLPKCTELSFVVSLSSEKPFLRFFQNNKSSSNFNDGKFLVGEFCSALPEDLITVVLKVVTVGLRFLFWRSSMMSFDWLLDLKEAEVGNS